MKAREGWFAVASLAAVVASCGGRSPLSDSAEGFSETGGTAGAGKSSGGKAVTYGGKGFTGGTAYGGTGYGYGGWRTGGTFSSYGGYRTGGTFSSYGGYRTGGTFSSYGGYRTGGYGGVKTGGTAGYAGARTGGYGGVKTGGIAGYAGARTGGYGGVKTGGTAGYAGARTGGYGGVKTGGTAGYAGARTGGTTGVGGATTGGASYGGKAAGGTGYGGAATGGTAYGGKPTGGAGGCPVVLGSSEELIDDMNDGDRYILPVPPRAGVWSDGPSGVSGMWPDPIGPFQMTPTGDPCHGYAVHIHGQVAGVETWFNFTLGGFYNASPYRGIAFSLKNAGADIPLHIVFPDKDTMPDYGICSMDTSNSSQLCWNHFGQRLVFPSTPSTWARYTVWFADLRQDPGWGYQAPAFDAATLYAVEFQITEGTLFDLWLDDVTFIR